MKVETGGRELDGTVTEVVIWGVAVVDGRGAGADDAGGAGEDDGGGAGV